MNYEFHEKREFVHWIFLVGYWIFSSPLFSPQKNLINCKSSPCLPPFFCRKKSQNSQKLPLPRPHSVHGLHGFRGFTRIWNIKNARRRRTTL